MKKHIHSIQDYISASPAGEFAGLEVIHAEEGEIHAVVDLLPYFKRHDGIAHGGFLSYLADSIMGFASLTLLDDDQTIFTAEMKISFLDPGFGSKILGKAKVIRSGKNIHFSECEVFGEKDGKQYLAAKASATMVVAQKRK